MLLQWMRPITVTDWFERRSKSLFQLKVLRNRNANTTIVLLSLLWRRHGSPRGETAYACLWFFIFSLQVFHFPFLHFSVSHIPVLHSWLFIADTVSRAFFRSHIFSAPSFDHQSSCTYLGKDFTIRGNKTTTNINTLCRLDISAMQVTKVGVTRCVNWDGETFLVIVLKSADLF